MEKSSDFLGTGWSFPPQFSADGSDVLTVSGAEDVHQSVHIILSTQLGERIMQEDFGCDLNTYVFEEIDQSLLNNIRESVTTALVRNESRIELDSVDIDVDEQDLGLVKIALRYLVRATNSRFNFVYPFYIDEAYR